MTVAFVAIVAVIVAASAIASWLGVAAIEKNNPPIGRFIDVPGGRLHVVELGPSDRPAVVLLHGASGNLGDMQLALGELLAARYRVILVDRPGHGWSERQGGRADASPARQAELIHAALLAIGIRRAVVVGHSWAGAVGAAYALDHPDAVAGLLLLAPVTHPWPGGVAWYNHVITTPFLGPLFARTFAYPVGKLLMWPGMRAVFDPREPVSGYLKRARSELILRAHELTANAEDIMGLRAFVTAQAPRYGTLQPRTIVITSDIDEIVSPEIHSRAIAAVLPNGRLIVVPGAGHMVQFAATAEIVAAIDELAAR